MFKKDWITSSHVYNYLINLVIHYFPHSLHIVLTSNNLEIVFQCSLFKFKFLGQRFVFLDLSINSTSITKLELQPMTHVVLLPHPIICCLCTHRACMWCRCSNGTFTLHPSTSSRGLHPQTCSGSKWFQILVDSLQFLRICLWAFMVANKSSKATSFRIMLFLFYL